MFSWWKCAVRAVLLTLKRVSSKITLCTTKFKKHVGQSRLNRAIEHLLFFFKSEISITSRHSSIVENQVVKDDVLTDVSELALQNEKIFSSVFRSVKYRLINNHLSRFAEDINSIFSHIKNMTIS